MLSVAASLPPRMLPIAALSPRFRCNLMPLCSPPPPHCCAWLLLRLLPCYRWRRHLSVAAQPPVPPRRARHRQPELRCHNQGAELVVGEAGVALGSLDFGLQRESLKRLILPYSVDKALSVQLLRFACGGFSVVWGIHNLVNDGSAMTLCVRMWSQLARTGRVAAGEPAVNHDRSVFRPRDPPAYGAAIDAMFTTLDYGRVVNALTRDASFVERLYYIEAADIARLRDEASTALRHASRVQAVSAYLWKALTAAVAASTSGAGAAEERCCLGWYVDGRRRVRCPELAAKLRNYYGNVAAYALGDAAVEEVRRKPLAEVADAVRDTIDSIDYDAYLQELVDWVEVRKSRTEHVMETAALGLGPPTVQQTMFASFPLDTDFDFGHAALALPLFEYGCYCSGFLSVGARPGPDGGDGSWRRRAGGAAMDAGGKSVNSPCFLSPELAE